MWDQRKDMSSGVVSLGEDGLGVVLRESNGGFSVVTFQGDEIVGGLALEKPADDSKVLKVNNTDFLRYAMEVLRTI